ncbi:aminodeoxychorismate lyase [Acidithiobacillus sp. CV18-2]|uniref:Aminodeoxychorismate lyase n=1 Tax=Igneacidithiobacillus copahuensis TaxID=2724909 RepID=A0AAE2YQ41_9PROT|nr:aminodeoxychorismate lyase [Acidithiobacillus sp. CV18-3]MBU2758252.1 aminodeoxychorismate lyase [Acidithiobacillus sp. BN09-2]MBU2777510.1 aminodeoxychorismate lyase [Acidithiobacillus sp. CV18-2]MBU2787931.1 aminodeoxychorismate lyase [Igneacidithiobacillus copahuensis]MBU2796824.1 aminodeoxychorismate lyase [Acidithiobacillus sp. VAN18-2]MBU2800434.1 aminodeoxychorismate lyase [Acidithiobacillus sp. VAN18-4]UTV80222.1 aminodeoxychorismate lyase [Acidithiobacillus sp. YTS05]
MTVLACSVDGVFQDPAYSLPFARALQYGDGLFETIAVISSQPLFWQQHLHRLSQGAAVLGIAVPDVATLLAHWQELLEGSPLIATSRRLVLKILLFRRDGQGYATPRESTGQIVFLLQDWPTRSKTYWQEGICAGLSTVPLQCGAPYLALKSLNRLNQIMARRALPEGWQEALLCDQQGYLREGIQSNVLWRRGDTLYTPDLHDGGIRGIQRDAILRQAEGWGLAVQTVRETPTALAEAEEILFCNSLIGFWPVQRWQDRSLPGAAGSLAQRLAAWHRELGLFPEAT